MNGLLHYITLHYKFEKINLMKFVTNDKAVTDMHVRYYSSINVYITRSKIHWSTNWKSLIFEKSML